MKNNLSKIIIIGILILVVAVVLFMKNRNREELRIPASVSEETSEALSSLDLGEKKVSNHQASSGSEKQEEIESNVETIRQKPQKIDKDILAVVNDFRITKDYLEERYESLPPQYKIEFNNDREGFLDQLIVWKLLQQEAARKGFGKDSVITDVEQRQNQAIQALIKDLTEKIQVSEDEMMRFYNDRKSDMRVSFQKMRSLKNCKRWG